MASLLLGVALAYGWWVTTLPTFSVAATVAVLGFGVAELGLAALDHGRRPARPRRSSTGRVFSAARFVPWGVGVAAFVAWELVMFVGHPRSAHPTISSLADPLLAHHGVRSVVFAAWAWLGWILAR